MLDYGCCESGGASLGRGVSVGGSVGVEVGAGGVGEVKGFAI